MKLLREIEDRRIEEVFVGDRCKQCYVPLGTKPDQVPRDPEFAEYCKFCGEDIAAPPEDRDYD